MSTTQPPSAANSPRFVNLGNFMRLPRLESAKGLDFAILGVPFDTGSSFRTGSRFGPHGIRKMSAMMKPNNPALGVNIMNHLKGADLGDCPITPGYILPSYDAIEASINEILKENAFPIVMGGDHAISLGELRAIAKKYGKVSLVHFDSHFDLCESVFGQKYNHGTPFRRALEEGLINPTTSIQMGMRGSFYYDNEIEMSEKLGFQVIPGHELHKYSAEQLGDVIRKRVGDTPVFLTFDIDFVDPAYAPGTGTPEVGGFTSFEALQFVRQLKDTNLIGFDVVEVAPEYDSSEITSYLAANLIFEVLSILAYQKMQLIEKMDDGQER